LKKKKQQNIIDFIIFKLQHAIESILINPNQSPLFLDTDFYYS